MLLLSNTVITVCPLFIINIKTYTRGHTRHLYDQKMFNLPPQNQPSTFVTKYTKHRILYM